MTKQRMGEIAVEILKHRALFPSGMENLAGNARLYARLTQEESREFSEAMHKEIGLTEAQEKAQHPR